MKHLRKVRIAAFALVTVAGGFHLSRAEAAPLRLEDCATQAANMANAYCASQEKGVSRYSFMCDEQTQTLLQISIYCS